MGQESYEVIHRFILGRVVDEPALTLSLDEADTAQVREVEGKRGVRYAKLLTNGAGIDTVRASLDQQAENGETGFMTQSSEKFGSVYRFHLSSMVEIYGEI